jgi:hypothetical protein
MVAFLLPTIFSIYPMINTENQNNLENPGGYEYDNNPNNQNQIPNNPINLESNDIDLSNYEINGSGETLSISEKVSNTTSGDISTFYDVRSDGFIDYFLISSYDCNGLAANTNFLSASADEREFSDLSNLFPLPYSVNSFGSAKKIGRFENIWTPWKSNYWYVGFDVFERNDAGSGELDYITWYSAFVINSTTTRVVNMLAGSDDEVWIFKDGDSIWNQSSPRGLIIDQDNIPITLNPGPNAFLIKVHDATGETGLCVRFNESGSALTSGIKVGLTETEKFGIEIPSGWNDLPGTSSISISNLYETGNWIYDISPNSWSGTTGGDTSDIEKYDSSDNYYTSTDDGTYSVSFTVNGSSGVASHSWDDSNPGWSSFSSRQSSYGTPDSHGWSSSGNDGGDGGQYRVQHNNPWLEPGSNTGRRWQYTVDIEAPRDWEATSMTYTAHYDSHDSGAESDDRMIYYIRLVHPSNDASFYTVDSYDDAGSDSSGILEGAGDLATTFNSLFPSVTSIKLEIAMDIILPGTVGGSGDDVWGNIIDLSFSITYTKKINPGAYYYISKNSPNFVGRQIPPTQANLYFAYKRTGSLADFSNSHIKTFVEGDEISAARIYSPDIDTSWKVVKVDVTSKITSSATDGINIQLGFYIGDIVVTSSRPEVIIDAIRLEIVVAPDPDDSNIGMYVRKSGSTYPFTTGSYGSGTAQVALGGNTEFSFGFTGSMYQITFDYTFQSIYGRSNTAYTNYTNNLDTGEVIWWISFDPIDIDTNLCDIETYEFTMDLPRDWSIDPNGVWLPGGSFGVDSSALQITDPKVGDPTKKEVRFYGIYPNGIMWDPYPVSNRDGLWQVKCHGVNYIGSLDSSLGETINPTNTTQIQISINQPTWTSWTISQGNFSVIRLKDDLNQDLNEVWNFTQLNSITTETNNINYNFNVSSVGKYMVVFSWKSSDSPLEIGYNYIMIDVIRLTNINISDLIHSQKVVIDGENISVTLPWWDNVLIPPFDNNVSGASPWIEIYSDQQGNLTNKLIENPVAYSWLSNLGEPYNGSNPEVISTSITNLVNKKEMNLGNYTIEFNTSQLVNKIGPGNRTLKIEYNKPYHQNISFLMWVFIISDTTMEWVDITTSGTDPKFAEAIITQGNAIFIKFRITDASRKRYENEYKNDINIDPFESIYLNNDTKITNNRMIINYSPLNSTWVEPDPRPKFENILLENKETFQISFKVSFDSPPTDTNENLFYYFNFTMDAISTQETMFQSAWCVNNSQIGKYNRHLMPGCLRVDVLPAQNTIQTCFVLNQTLDLDNKTWDDSLRVDVKWNDDSSYNHSSGFSWDSGIMSLHLVLINDTTVTSGSPYPLPNGTAPISNTTGKHIDNVSFYENGWHSRGGDSVNCTQVGDPNDGIYRIDINVTSVPTIFSSEVGSEYNIRLKMKMEKTVTVNDTTYSWEEATFTLNLVVLPNDAEVSLEFFTPARNDLYWGDTFNVTIDYLDITNNLPIKNVTDSVTIEYEVLYYIGGTPYVIYTNYVEAANQSEHAGVYYTLTIDTNDPSFINEFELEQEQTSREFFVKFYAFDIGFTSPTPDPNFVIHRHKYYSTQWDFSLKARIVDMQPPEGDHFKFTGWSNTAEIARNDYLNFTIQIIDNCPRAIDDNISIRAPIENVNVSWFIPEWALLGNISRGWALTDETGNVSFSIGTHYPGIQFDRPYEIRVTFSKQNYESYTRSFNLEIIKIPLLIRWVGTTPGCTQGDIQKVKINVYDNAYNEERRLVSDLNVYCRVMLGPDPVYEEFMLQDHGNGTYTGEINTWPAIFSWLEAKSHEIEFEIRLSPEIYESLDYGTAEGHATIIFNIDTAGPFGPLTLPITIILGIVGAVVGVYVSYKSYKFLTTPYPIRKINESLKKIGKNKKVASGVMKSREHLIYLEMARRFKLVGIKLEAPSEEKLEPIWEPTVLKKEKEELMKKIPTIPLDLIENELMKAGITQEELPMLMSQIKDLDIVDRHDFISSLVGEERWAKIEEDLKADMEKIETGKEKGTQTEK